MFQVFIKSHLHLEGNTVKLNSISPSRVESKPAFKGALKLPYTQEVYRALNEVLNDFNGDFKSGVNNVVRDRKDYNLNFDNQFHERIEQDVIRFLYEKGILKNYVYVLSPNLTQTEFDIFAHTDMNKLLKNGKTKKFIAKRSIDKRA